MTCCCCGWCFFSQEAADVLESAYVLHANSKQRAALVSEFYGPHYAITKVNVFSLSNVGPFSEFSRVSETYT